MPEKIIPTLIEKEMKESYLDYSMSVIVGRALPDIKDGLKPVHRRILYAMHQEGLTHEKKFTKCAGVVGSVLKYFHPHGDISVYDALVRLAQPWSLRYMLVKGQGNFGSQDGDPPAAYRYCITGDSLILTNKGILPFSTLSDKKEDKLNLEIMSYNGTKNIASKFFNSGKHKIIKILTKAGFSLEGSYNHPILTWHLGIDFKPKIEWKLLEHLHEGDIVLINRNNQLFSNSSLHLEKFFPLIGFKKKDITLPKVMNNELAFLLGALVSEGSYHRNQILFNNKDLTFYNKVKSILENQFKEIKLYERKVKGDCLELSIYEQKVVLFLKKIGFNVARSAEKEIPHSILKSSKENIKNFLIALYEGDGSVSFITDKRHGGKSLVISYDSKSENLIRQLKILLLNFGIVTNYPQIDKRNNCLKLLITLHENLFNFYNELGFFSERKNRLLEQIKTLNGTRLSKNDFIPFLNDYLRNNYRGEFIVKNNFDRYNSLKKNYLKLIKLITLEDKNLIDFLLTNNYYFDQIIKIDKLGEKEVFSVKVDSTCHSFIANGFINHNTECKLDKIAAELLKDIDKETVDFVPNFDGTTDEPVVLPAKLPNLLINGSSGIAVGMATNIPPHNIHEIIDAVLALIENPELDVTSLMNYVKGPDFPTGAQIIGIEGIRQAYKTGKGKLVVRSKYELEEGKIVITEIPYQLNKSLVVEEIARLVKDKIVEGISDLRDESDRDGMRIVIELKKDMTPEIVLNQLYKHSQLQNTFGINIIALVDGEPKQLNLKDCLTYYLQHRRNVVRRRTLFELKKAEQRDHVLQGLLIALKSIDEVIQLIRNSQDVETARTSLIANYILTEIQANAILDMKLSRLAALEQQKLLDEHYELLKFITEMKEILASEIKIYGIIKDELLTLKSEFGDKRRTLITYEENEDLQTEQLLEKEDVVITVTHSGYIKRQSLDVYRSQRRGGRGILGTETKGDDDFVEHLFIANTHSSILTFTDKGVVHWVKAYKIPDAGRYAKGSALVNLITLTAEEKVTSLVVVDEFKEDHYLVMATKNGIIKKTSLGEYSRPRNGGIIGINLREDDRLIDVKLTDGTKQLMMATKDGRAVRFKESDVHAVGRNSIGVRGINVKTSEVIGMEIVNAPYLLTVTEKGYGKRSLVEDYRLINRGGSGVTNIKITDKNGNVVGIKTIDEKDEIMLISKLGVIIRTPVTGVSVIGRNTQGVKIMNLDECDKLSTVARIIGDDIDLELKKEEFKPSEDVVETTDESFEKKNDSENEEGMGDLEIDDSENKPHEGEENSEVPL